MQAACLSPRVFTETDDHDHIVPDRCVFVCVCVWLCGVCVRARAHTHAHQCTHTHTHTHTHTFVFGFQALDAMTSCSCFKQYNALIKREHQTV